MRYAGSEVDSGYLSGTETQPLAPLVYIAYEIAPAILLIKLVATVPGSTSKRDVVQPVRAMRILHAISSLSGGGAERQLSYLAPEQARSGHQVAVVYLTKREDQGLPLPKAVHWKQLRAGSNYDPRIVWQLLRHIRAWRPEVLHTWIVQMDVLAGFAARLTGTPWVFRENASAALYSGSWKDRLRVHAVRGADAIVSNSATGGEYWAEKSPDSRRYVVTNALPLQEIEAAQACSSAALGLPDGCEFILHAGRHEDGAKNLSTLVSALERVLDQTTHHVILCGEGPFDRELRSLTKAARLSDRVHFKGFVTNIWSYMKAAALLISTSRHEGRPNAVMEAMACECPLVVSDIPGHREFLDEESALFVDQEDPDSIAQAILTSIRDDAAARARAAKARRITLDWSISAMAEGYERVYLDCLNSRRAPSR